MPSASNLHAIWVKNAVRVVDITKNAGERRANHECTYNTAETSARQDSGW